MKDTSPGALTAQLLEPWRGIDLDLGDFDSLKDDIASLIRRERAACIRIARGGLYIADVITERNRKRKK